MQSPYASLASPEPWLILEITNECNLRCKHCHFWRTAEDPAALRTEEKLRVLDEFYHWKKGGKVLFSGGETLLKAEEVLRLAARTRELGLYSIALSNGTLLDADLIDRVLQSGVSQLSISLDAPTAEAYDFTRGVAGTFDRAVTSLKQLVKRKKELSSSVILHVNSILTRSSLASLRGHLDFVRDLGVDGIFLFPLDPTFQNREKQDLFYEKERLRPNAATSDAFEFLLAYQESRGFVCNSREDLELVREGIFSERASDCASPHRNFIVDAKGNTRFCFSMEEFISEGKSLGNVRTAPLRDLFSSPTACEFHRRMLECRQPCATLNCNRPTVN